MDITELINNRPLTLFQKRVMVLIGCLVMMDGFDVQAMGFVAPALVKAWTIEPSALGPIFGAGLLGMLIGSTSLGILADRIGRRPVIIGATLFFGACTLATALAEAVPQMLVLRLLTGIGIGGVMGNAVALASEYSPTRKRASLLMWISCGFTGGAMLGGLLSAMLIPWGGWQSVFVVGGLLPLLVAAIMWWQLPESLGFLLLRTPDSSAVGRWLKHLAPDLDGRLDAPAQPAATAEPAMPVAALFRGGRGLITPLLWAINFANLLNLFFLANWLPLLTARIGYATSVAVLIGTTLQAGGLIGALFMGPLIDRLGFHKILVPAFLCAAATIALLGAPDLPSAPLFVSVFIAGFCVVGAQPAINALATTLYPTELRGTGVGWCLGIGRAGSILGPVVAARLIALHWSNQDLFLFAAIPAGLSAVMMTGIAHAISKKAAGSRDAQIKAAPR